MFYRALPVAAAALLLGGCGVGEPPEVVFTVGENSVTADPAQYCNLEFTSCDDNATAPVRLDVPPGSPLRVTVPDDIAETPWHVAFSYRTTAGEQVDARSPLFAPKQRTDFTLELPATTDRLLTAQVQQFGPPPQADATTGEISFPIRASWVLTTPSLTP